MKPKTIVTAVLLIFVVVSAVYLVFNETARDESPAQTAAGSGEDLTSTPENAEAAQGHRVVVYYFHATKRCWTCKTIEAYAEEAIRKGFSEQLASGAMEWRTVNVEEPENKHFIEDFQLATRSVVLADVEDGVNKRFERLDRVWELVRDKPAFVDYIWENTNDFLADING